MSIVKRENASISRDDVITQDKIATLKQTIAKGATDSELELFVATCNRLRLDPFARQIFLVKRYDAQARTEVASPQVSIDGLRLVAERTGQYRGQTTPQWCGQDGKWVDVWLSSEPPAAARCGVYRDGFAEPLVRVAKLGSYIQLTRDKQSGEMRPNRMWSTMPEVMLSKCAESLALRAAFPNELSGIYTVDEMGQATNDTPRTSGKPAPSKRTLDSVADIDPTRDAEPANVMRLEYDQETGEVRTGPFGANDEIASAAKRTAVVVDDQGIPVPQSPCPTVSKPGPHHGKPWSALPSDVIQKMYLTSKDKMTREQRDWAEYLMMANAAKVVLT